MAPERDEPGFVAWAMTDRPDGCEGWGGRGGRGGSVRTAWRRRNVSGRFYRGERDQSGRDDAGAERMRGGTSGPGGPGPRDADRACAGRVGAERARAGRGGAEGARAEGARAGAD